VPNYCGYKRTLTVIVSVEQIAPHRHSSGVLVLTSSAGAGDVKSRISQWRRSRTSERFPQFCHILTGDRPAKIGSGKKAGVELVTNSATTTSSRPPSSLQPPFRAAILQVSTMRPPASLTSWSQEANTSWPGNDGSNNASDSW